MFSQVRRLSASVLTVAAVWNLGAVTCSAHPDHPVKFVSSDSVLHYVLEPEHALPLVVLAVAAWWLSRAVAVRLAARETV